MPYLAEMKLEAMDTNFETDIDAAVSALRGGKVILYPTDTVWGIGCDATDAEAVKRVYALKRRDDSKALIVLVSDMDSLLELTTADADTVRKALDSSDGRPTTVVLPASGGLASNLLASDGTVGIRITGEYFSNRLCCAFGRPLVSTSANISGDPAAAVFADINGELIARADYICFSRREETSAAQPSRIVKVENDGSIKVIRP